jgi:hypothetical protein
MTLDPHNSNDEESGPTQSGTAPPFLDSPSVSSIIEEMDEKRGAIISQLRSLTLSQQNVEERALFDHFCREWTPAYYVGRGQLFHVHNFRSGLRATMFMGANTLAPFILASEDASPELRDLVAETTGTGRVGQLRVSLASAEDVNEFMDLVRIKWQFLRKRQRPQKGGGELTSRGV